METKYLSCAETAKTCTFRPEKEFPRSEVFGKVERLQRGSLNRCVMGAWPYYQRS